MLRSTVAFMSFVDSGKIIAPQIRAFDLILSPLFGAYSP